MCTSHDVTSKRVPCRTIINFKMTLLISLCIFSPARGSKWGRLLGSASLDSASESSSQPQAFTRSLSAKDPKERPSSSSSGSSGGQPTSGSGNKIFPKLQKVSATSSPGITRQDTIDEMVEVEQPHLRNLSLRKMQSYDCGLRDPTTASMYQSAVPETIAPIEYKELMTNLMDFKVLFSY